MHRKTAHLQAKQITPTCERIILPLVGSGMKQASAR